MARGSTVPMTRGTPGRESTADFPHEEGISGHNGGSRPRGTDMPVFDDPDSMGDPYHGISYPPIREYVGLRPPIYGEDSDSDAHRNGPGDDLELALGREYGPVYRAVRGLDGFVRPGYASPVDGNGSLVGEMADAHRNGLDDGLDIALGREYGPVYRAVRGPDGFVRPGYAYPVNGDGSLVGEPAGRQDWGTRGPRHPREYVSSDLAFETEDGPVYEAIRGPDGFVRAGYAYPVNGDGSLVGDPAGRHYEAARGPLHPWEYESSDRYDGGRDLARRY